MTLQVMVTIEALGALVALERPIGCWARHTMVGRRMGPVEMLRVGNMPTIETRQDTRLHTSHHRHGTIRAVDIGHDGARHRGEGIRRPGLAREGQRRLATGTLERHARAGVDSKASVAAKGIVACVDGRESGLMARGGVQGMHFLIIRVIRWQRCGRCRVARVIEAHGDRMRTGSKSGGWRGKGLRKGRHWRRLERLRHPVCRRRRCHGS